ncbi:SafA/ExsA family spore coat assembly protein [Calidifontibacillus oryziterrae]|uniref:SafA/ExsA family spore coat assembly protein n=1 Tax=Calidifontibacillus oryziterrae TaxID=1191699 RepID=UPI0002EEFD6F|nr:SafA/ExsA family spore coat assembly protein [Calidifontibacillus oryziterrae]
MKIHIVQKGDTLWKIAQKYGVDFQELKNVNTQLSNPDMIMPGMKIKVPTGSVPVKKNEVPKEMPVQPTPIPPMKEMPVAPAPPKKEMPVAPAPPKKEMPVAPVPPKKEMPVMPPVPPAPQVPVKEEPLDVDLHVQQQMYNYTFNIPTYPTVPYMPTPEAAPIKIKSAPEQEPPKEIAGVKDDIPKFLDEEAEDPMIPAQPMPTISPTAMYPQYCIPVTGLLPGSGLPFGFHPGPYQGLPIAQTQPIGVPYGAQPGFAAAGVPYGAQPGFAPAGVPYGAQPGFAADGVLYGAQPGFAADGVPYGTQPGFAAAGVPYGTQPGFAPDGLPYGTEPGSTSTAVSPAVEEDDLGELGEMPEAMNPYGMMQPQAVPTMMPQMQHPNIYNCGCGPTPISGIPYGPAPSGVPIGTPQGGVQQGFPTAVSPAIYDADDEDNLQGYPGISPIPQMQMPASGGDCGCDGGPQATPYGATPASDGSMSGYGAAPAGYGAMPGYGAAPAGYGAMPGYGVAPSGYGAMPGYGAAPAGYGAMSGYGAAPSGYGAMPGYGATPAGYGSIPGYGAAPAGYGAMPGYGAAPSGYGAMPGYGATPAGYGSMPGYGAAPAGYGTMPGYEAAPLREEDEVEENYEDENEDW